MYVDIVIHPRDKLAPDTAQNSHRQTYAVHSAVSNTLFI